MVSSAVVENEREEIVFPEGLGSFDRFCEGLRAELGIPFEAHHQIRLAMVCDRLACRGITLGTASEASLHLTPVIATDAHSQAAVYQYIRDVWQGSYGAVGEPAYEAVVLPETEIVERALMQVDRGRRKLRRAFGVVVGVVGVFLGALLIYALLNSGAPTPNGDAISGNGGEPQPPSQESITFGAERAGSRALTLAAFILLGVLAAILWLVARFGRHGVLRGLAFRSHEGSDLYFDGLGIQFLSALSGPRSVDALARHREVPARGIDVQSSVVRTVRSGGLAQLVPKTVRRLPQYLLISSRESADDHHAGLADDVHARLAERQVVTRRYDFFGSPLKAWEVGTAGRAVDAHSFGDLLAVAQSRGWILIDDTEDLFDPTDRSIYGWVRALAAAAPGLVMTSKPGSAWSWREAALENEGIKVLSVMEDDLRVAADFLSGRTMLVGSRHGWPNEHSAYRFLKRMTDALPADPNEPPDTETQEQVIGYLRGYFAFAANGEATFELFVATCIYPELKPDLTRMIARAARDDGNHLLASEVGLGALFALPWFRVGRIPQWLREKAVSSVEAERLTRLEQCVHAVLLAPQDRGRLNLKIAGRYPGLIAEKLYRLLPRDGSARRDAIFLRSLDRGAEPGALGVSKAFVRRALGPSRGALGVRAAVAATAIAVAVYAMFSPGVVRFPADGPNEFFAGYWSELSSLLVGAWTKPLLEWCTVVGALASVAAVALRQVGADGRTVRSLWRFGAWLLVGAGALALVEPFPNWTRIDELYVAPLWVFAIATLYVTYVLHRAGEKRISNSAWKGIARGRILSGIVVAWLVVVMLAVAGGAFTDSWEPVPGTRQPVWAAMGAVLLVASAARAIGLARTGLLVAGGTFICGYLAGWALAWDMTVRFELGQTGEARYFLAGQAGLISAAIALAFYLARHGLDLRAPVVFGALFHASLTLAVYASGLSPSLAVVALPLTIAVGFLASLGSGMVRAPATAGLPVTDVLLRWRYSLGSFLLVAVQILFMEMNFDIDGVTWEVMGPVLFLSALWVWPVLRGGLQACAGPLEAETTEMAWDVSGRPWIWLFAPGLLALLSYRYHVSDWSLVLDILCVPVAIWLGARHGRTGFWVCAVGFFPLLAEIPLGDVSSSGWIGGYFASLLACRYAGSSEFRCACFSARRLSRQQIAFLAIGFCFMVSFTTELNASDLRADTFLYFYVLAVVFLIGTSRIGLGDFIGPVVAVWFFLFATMLFRSEFHFTNIGPFSLEPAVDSVDVIVSVLVFFALGRLFRSWIAVPEVGPALVAPLAVVCFVVLVFYSFGVAGSYEVGQGATFVFRVDPIGYHPVWAVILALGVIGGGRGLLASIGVLAAVKVGIPIVVNVLPLSGVLTVATDGLTAPVLDLDGAVHVYWRNFGGIGGLQYFLDGGWRIGVGDFLLALAGWRIHKAVTEARESGRLKKEIEAASGRIQAFGATEPPLLRPNSYFDIAMPVAKVGLVAAAFMLIYNARLVLYSLAFL